MVNGDSGSPRHARAVGAVHRAGCDFGAAAVPTSCSRTPARPNGDMTKVFGADSPEWTRLWRRTRPAGTAARNLAQTDFVGSRSTAPPAADLPAIERPPDLLPDEPGGYTRFHRALRCEVRQPGHHRRQTPRLNDLNGQPITDQFNHAGLPGLRRTVRRHDASWYIAQMQEAGIPVTYGYISDAHDQHGRAGRDPRDSRPGRSRLRPAVKNYDTAFAKFFDRLAADGINKSNTLFVVHRRGRRPLRRLRAEPAGCDGVNMPCTYTARRRVNGNLAGLMAQDGVTTPFTVHADMAPTIYITGQSGDGPRDRTFGRTRHAQPRVNPYTASPRTSPWPRRPSG
jgi:hypothetical protein